MNFYDLDEQATPPYWQAVGCAVDNSQIGRVLIACDTPNTSSTPTSVQEADMLLAAHCRNYFRKALDALKEELAKRMETYVSAMADDRDRTDADERTDFLRALIAELEEVKT